MKCKTPKRKLLNTSDIDSSTDEEEQEECVVKKPLTKSIKLTRKSKNFISKLPVEATGALANTLLAGCSKRTNKALVKVTGTVKPYRNVHDQIKEMGEWNEFVRRCQVLPGFREDVHLSTNIKAMEEWLTTNAREGSLAPLGSDHTDDRIIIDRPGDAPSQFLLMGDQICEPKGFTWQEVQNFIPRPAKTKECKSHTLVLHRSGFQIATNIENPLTKFKQCSLLLDLELQGEVTKRVTRKQFVLVAPNCGVFYESNPSLKKPYIPDSKLGELGILIARMDNGELKSFLQKLIRFAPLKVEMGHMQYDTNDVLQAVCECCLVHPGGKSPTTGLFARGLPTFLKRLAVTMVEDAWLGVDQNTEIILHDLFLMSIIASNDPNYFPTASQLVRICSAAQYALVSSRGVVYQGDQAGGAIILKRGLSHLQRASCFLDILKSFPWDLTMVRFTAEHEKTQQFQNAHQTQRPKVMDISHHLDHHVGPEFAYFLDSQALVLAKQRYVPSQKFGDLNDQHSKPFAVLFREVFQCCSGFNYRRTPNKLDFMLNTDELAIIIRRAQSMYFLAKHVPFVTVNSQYLPLLEEKIDIEIELDPMWLAACIGHMTVRVDKMNYFVFITQVEPVIELDVVRCPSRQQKDIEIDETARRKAISLGFKMLQSGCVKLQQKEELFGNVQEVILVENQLHLKDAQTELPFLPNLLVSSETKSDFSIVKELFNSTSIAALQRLWQLSLGFCTMIEFPKIARNGGPEDQPICIHDIEVFQLCLKLLPILQLHHRRYFAIVERVTWWHIRAEILKPCITAKLLQDVPAVFEEKKNNSDNVLWTIHEDSRKRAATKQQQIALRVLDRRSTEANFIIMPAGSGKNYIIGQYLLLMAKKKQLPEYVLFTTPASAVEGVVRELQCFTDDVYIRDMTKSKKQNNDLQPGITVISHDHLRLVGDMFCKTLPKTHMVLDEFQWCLSQKTQRTKTALEFAAQAANLTAMSGTPTLSSNLFDLLPLLSKIVPFELTLNNFFVGYSYAVNQKDGVDIKVINQEHNIIMPSNHVNFWNLLPTSLGGKNDNRLEGVDLNNLIQYSQDVANFKIVELAVHHVKNLKNVVFIVARKTEHVQELHDLLVSKKIASNEIYCVFQRKDAITLTENSIESKARCKDPRIRRYSFIICPISVNCGFSMQIANVQISTVYCSNASSREQIRGRIKRLGSIFKVVLYETVICGRIQELIYFRYAKDDSLVSILKDLALPAMRDLTAAQHKILFAKN